VHAKGIVLTGKFTPSTTAASLSTAPHFQGGTLSVVARFSNFAGIPAVADTDPLADPRGLALRFHLPDGSDTDLVTHSFNGFPAATSDEFRRFLTALGTSPPGTPSPTPASTYLAAHPVAQHFMAAQQGPPTSYATLAYFGVNAFAFRNDKGVVQFGRYRIVPVGGVQLLGAAQIAEAAPDYLATELRTRVARAPIRFRLYVQLAGEGDQIDNPAIAWPESRPLLDLGLLEISAVAPDSAAADRELMFLPTKLPAGIEPADPMLVDRGNAYPESFRRRQQ
jgi:catalase